jgi:hypothetical protein
MDETSFGNEESIFDFLNGNNMGKKLQINGTPLPVLMLQSNGRIGINIFLYLFIQLLTFG